MADGDESTVTGVETPKARGIIAIRRRKLNLQHYRLLQELERSTLEEIPDTEKRLEQIQTALKYAYEIQKEDRVAVQATTRWILVVVIFVFICSTFIWATATNKTSCIEYLKGSLTFLVGAIITASFSTRKDSP